ncbi:hypothetical protein SAMN05444487_10992 [Marininema mesophilum]|uniref:Uncharacterized protein n=1 Tax=Marininema mesophilum TaxID=1048340 RepID=A0A1H2YKR0_9BACL|nr:hypothetical protein [Marininema mesophilum]SDX05119.1 hypothetical protein SAMN05444487_10992 [Marininema mesophilum]
MDNKKRWKIIYYIGVAAVIVGIIADFCTGKDSHFVMYGVTVAPILSSIQGFIERSWIWGFLNLIAGVAIISLEYFNIHIFQ